jgi:hypothetical protein
MAKAKPFVFQTWHLVVLVLLVFWAGSSLVPESKSGEIPEFDETDKNRTIEMELPSYYQQTNHAPGPKVNSISAYGVRVNQVRCKAISQ